MLIIVNNFFFRKRALARVALSGSWKVYTLRDRSRRGADPHHGVAHNMNHRKRWGTKVVLTKHLSGLLCLFML
jgi:hypothetical protein